MNESITKGTSSTRRDEVLDIEQIEYIEKCLLMIECITSHSETLHSYSHTYH